MPGTTSSHTHTKNGVFIDCGRVFTPPHKTVENLVHFKEVVLGEDETTIFECPDHWSELSAEVASDCVTAHGIPMQLRVIEENTVPSWLWQHVAVGQNLTQENSALQIINRIVGAAVYKGWKLNLFQNEIQACNFYDEASYALAIRSIAIEPKIAAQLGLDWAYDIKASAPASKGLKTNKTISLSNQVIDAFVSGEPAQWNKLVSSNKAPSAHVIFNDVAHDWADENTATQAAAVLDLMAFRHNDGSINFDHLCHATKLLTILLDLLDVPVAIGFINLAPLLMALALPYDSDAGRNLAAAIMAIITAEAYGTSAELASMRGPCTDFIKNRENILRNLRNHRRAAYGDRNDYEKLSVIPVPLDLKKSPDLALVNAVQHRWDDALELARQHGLRHTQTTTLNVSKETALFTETTVPAIAPMQSLLADRDISPVVTEALSRLGFDRASSDKIIAYIGGMKNLTTAPTINHRTLRARGFDDDALQAVENYLPEVNDIRLAFTPWILGENFCVQKLKVPAQKLQKMDFDLLGHIGFGADDIKRTNSYCYGHNTVAKCKDMDPRRASVFAKAAEVSAEARIHMAASLQSFTSAAISVDLQMDGNANAQTAEKLLLSAWRQGLRGLNLTHSSEAATQIQKKKSVAAFLHLQPRPSLPARSIKAKASRRMMGIKTASDSKSGGRGKTK